MITLHFLSKHLGRSKCPSDFTIPAAITAQVTYFLRMLRVGTYLVTSKASTPNFESFWIGTLLTLSRVWS